MIFFFSDQLDPVTTTVPPWLYHGAASETENQYYSRSSFLSITKPQDSMSPEDSI